MDALIVAGGRGTRLQPLTYTTMKPLLPFCGTPFLIGLVARLVAAEVDRVLLVVGDDTSPFEVLRDPLRELGAELALVPEPEPLDTAGGVRSVVSELSDDVLVLNGDILTDLDYAATVRRHREAGADATIALTRVDDTSSYGVCVRDGTRIVEFVEKPPTGTLPGQDAVNAGTYVLDPDVLLTFEQGPLSFERDVFPGILADGGHIEGFVWEGVWADLGTPERFRDGHRLALSRELGWPPLDEVPERSPGVRVAPEAQVDADAIVVPPVLILDGARVEAPATVGPYAVVGRGVTVGAGATIADTVLFDDVEVGDGVAAFSLLAGEGVSIEPGVRLGSGNVLGAGEHLRSGELLRDGERVPPAER
ncbi:MAG: NDP-sugar synthase [Nitriliruptorales bacterium]|nr:NDP-sugar synthase [Nitriliruptorales bacterium]